MGRYIVQRLTSVVPTLLLLMLAVVLMIRMMPANVVDVILEGQRATPQERHQLEDRLGIDKSLPQQYVEYVGGIFKGSLGTSLIRGRPVRTMITERVNITLELAAYALVFGWAIGAGCGILSAIFRDGPVDYVLRSVAIVGLTVPTFAVATLAVLLPAIYFKWSPPLTYVPWARDHLGHLKQFILPGIVLGFASAGAIMRVTRTQMLEVLRQDFVRTARAKGLRDRRVVYRHVLRNAMIPVVAIFGLQVAALISGSVIIENIFSLPGIGSLMLNAINQRDYTVVQGVTFMVGALVMLINLLVDLSYVLIDPRVKFT
jgi:peptide/nickel transport system permease protein